MGLLIDTSTTWLEQGDVAEHHEGLGDSVVGLVRTIATDGATADPPPSTAL